MFFRFTFLACLMLVSLLRYVAAFGQNTANYRFDVRMENPASHQYHVTFRCPAGKMDQLDVKMPAWTPGYYQMMNYAANVGNVQATDEMGKALAWKKTGNNTWQVQTRQAKTLVMTYDVTATRNFVASPFLDENKGYISPAGVFMYVKDQLQQPVTVTVHPDKNWSPIVATGLDSVAGQAHTFMAPNYDILYDSPILMGKLESLPSFTVRGIPHYFVGYNMGPFDHARFMADLKKIVESSADIIDDIPYKHYTFLAIGPGGGGIEHLNSTSISFTGKGLDTPEGRFRMYSFLAHEYFHHYNVKRIRPINLGPFDYENENRTNMLWVSEGFTVYYEYLALRRAGLLTQDELLTNLQNQIQNFENKPGRLFQSATQASYDTWADGPFGRTGDEAYKTISYYEKGPLLGTLLDFAIRNATHNKKSLDNVMRTLYQEYYAKQNRGFTDAEFQKVCETIAGTSLKEIFTYASTTRPVDYRKFLAYAGLTLTEKPKELPGGWLGLSVREKADSVLVTDVEWNSPAWKAGIRTGAVIRTLNQQPAKAAQIQELSKRKSAGELVTMALIQNNKPEEKIIKLGVKTIRNFQLTKDPSPTALQAAILADWSRGRGKGDE
ncbi:M61 family metallopeptidase [Spirosoma sp. KUDC1026]|uniref:M61 family metallopeptidase n=1 Tax=Spirosoma sp. KUDC1026 TaxID=2745947 RepID=UPI00159BD841|nr:PDZ domain-containing protein [Spirosoma sp. KUDC1026]QKZ14860.1 M61 family metallopeptidase [Spirosoma sp. KUDC1026]